MSDVWVSHEFLIGTEIGLTTYLIFQTSRGTNDSPYGNKAECSCTALSDHRGLSIRLSPIGGHLLYFPSTHAICAGHGIPSFSFLHRERVRRNNRASVVQRGLLWLYCSLWYYSGSFTVSVGALPGAVFLRHPNWCRATKEKTLCEQSLNHLMSVVRAFITPRLLG